MSARDDRYRESVEAALNAVISGERRDKKIFAAARRGAHELGRKLGVRDRDIPGMLPKLQEAVSRVCS